jgi:hypothetical protein
MWSQESTFNETDETKHDNSFSRRIAVFSVLALQRQ